MSLSHVIPADSQPNFVNLSLFICQLFVGGNFRIAHILYYPEAFDDRFISLLDATCSVQIPMVIIDATGPGKIHYEKLIRNAPILQLFFLSTTICS